MTILNTFALAVHLLLGLDAAAKRTDGFRIQGVWQVTAATEDGRDAPPEREARVRVVIAGDVVSVRDRDGVQSARCVLDPSRNPRRLALTPAAGLFKGRTLVGIYHFEADRLLLCLPTRPDQDAPTDLSARPGSARVLLTLRRSERPAE